MFSSFSRETVASLCPLVTEGQSQQRRRLTKVKFNFSQTQYGHSRSQCILAYLLLCFKKIHVNPLGDEASAGGMPVGWAGLHSAGQQCTLQAASLTPKLQSFLQRLLNASLCFKIRCKIFKSCLAHSRKKTGS